MDLDFAIWSKYWICNRFE